MSNDISVLSCDLLEREKKRKQERENDKKELKEEIQKHNSIDSTIDFSAVFNNKLECLRDEMKKDFDEKLLQQQKHFFDLFES